MSESLDSYPTLPDYANEDPSVPIGRRPGFGEYMRASLQEGWWGTTLGAVGAQVRAGDAADANPEPLQRHEWEASAYWRQGVPWDDRMTVGRAQAIAETFDENRYRRRLMDARNPGMLEWGIGFLGQMGGAVADPVNFLPVAGPAARAFRFGESLSSPLSRAAGAAATALERPGLVGGFTRGAAEGVVGNAVAAPYVYSVQQQFGDEVTWGRVVTDLAVGGLIGGAFGAAFNRAGAGRLIEPDPIMATRILDSVANDMAAGRAVEFPAGLARTITDDAVARAAPPEAAPFLRATDDGAGTVTYRPDLPTRPDGTPLTREEFDVEMASRRQEEVAREQVASTPNAIAARAAPDMSVRAEAAPQRAATAATATATPNAPTARETVAPFSHSDRAYQWYVEALELTRAQERMAMPPADPMMATPARRAAMAGDMPDRINAPRAGAQAAGEAAAGRAGGPARAGKADADPVLGLATNEIEAMRAAGRFTEADAALLRAGNEAADEMDSISRGLTEAGACTLRTMT